MGLESEKRKASLAGAAVMLVVLAAVPQPVAAGSDAVVTIRNGNSDDHRHLKLGLNKALVVDLPESAHDILVADPTVADAVIRSANRIYLFGKSVGQTNIIVFGPDSVPALTLDITVERDVAGLEANLNRFIQDAAITVEIVSDNIVLTGTVRSALDATLAVDLATAFLKGGEATTRSETATSSGGGQGSVALFAEARQTSQIVNLLQIQGEDQVTLKVTVAEIRRDILKQIGFDHVVSGSNGVAVAQLGSSSSDASTATTGGGLAALFKGSLGGYDLSMYLNALEQAKVVKSLAEPTLTAISGQAASFSSGGQALYSTTDDDGNTTYTAYDYGIDLAFKPVVLSAGRISLEISAKVSEPTTSVSGSVPTYQKRSAKTSIEIPSGGSLVLGGLLQNNVSQTTNGTPGLSKFPVIGALFRQKTNEIVESEIVIIATAYLVRPVGQANLSQPADNFSPADDAEAFFLNRVNKIYGNNGNDASPGRYQGSVGFIYK
ncbi:pilus assembly protein CpaC [Rhizobium mongolense]